MKLSEETKVVLRATLLSVMEHMRHNSLTEVPDFILENIAEKFGISLEEVRKEFNAEYDRLQDELGNARNLIQKPVEIIPKDEFKIELFSRMSDTCIKKITCENVDEFNRTFGILQIAINKDLFYLRIELPSNPF
ncbi:hypothetical protein [Bacillus phage vB_BceS-M2]